MSEPTPTLDAYIEVSHRVAKAWDRVLGEVVYEEVKYFLPICNENYAFELMFPEGNEEWDIFV